MIPTIEEQIRNYINQNILFSKGYRHPDEASFLEEGIVDSLNVMELVFFVEERFGLSVETCEIIPDNFDSVARLATFVRGKTQTA